MGRWSCLSGETLSAFTDGELALAEARAIQRHLHECADCVVRLAAFSELDSKLAADAGIGCLGVSQLLSAALDGELSGHESVLLAAHLERCADCSVRRIAWARLDTALALLPSGTPSARVDLAIRALADRGRRAPRRKLLAPVALRLAAASVAAGALAVILTLPQGRSPVAQDAPASVQNALVAAVQQTVINPRTNILYVLLPDSGSVAALDATTQAQLAVIHVGGRPSALALNEAANTILVLDSASKTVTEIDGGRNTITATVAVPGTGTPTSIQVDQASGRIVVSAAAIAAPAGTASAGSVIVFDGSLKLQASRPVDVAPRYVVLDASGARALLVSSELTTIVDGATYKAIGELPGGISAAFAAKGDGIAILSATAGGAQVSLSGDARQTVALTISLSGKPLAIIGLPQGGYAALLDVGGNGTIAEIALDGSVRTSADVFLAGRDLSYDASAHRYTVSGTRGIAYADGGALALASPAPQQAPAAAAVPAPPSGAPSPAVSSAPIGQPSSAPAAVVKPTPPAPAFLVKPKDLFDVARLTWPGTWHLDLPADNKPAVIGHGSGARLWYVDQDGTLSALDPATATSYPIAQLPTDARIRQIEIGAQHVYAIDGASNRVFVVSLPSERVSIITLPFLRTTAAITVTPDDRLWFAVADSGQILTLDPATKAIQAANIGIYDVSALAADVAGRLWIADEARHAISLYDPGSHSVTEYRLDHDGPVTAMAVDGRGTVWVGTSTGQLLGVRGGSLITQRNVEGRVAMIAVSADGSAWYATDGADLRYGPVDGGTASIGPRSMQGLWLDAQGRAWLGDSASPGFYLSLREPR